LNIEKSFVGEFPLDVQLATFENHYQRRYKVNVNPTWTIPTWFSVTIIIILLLLLLSLFYNVIIITINFL